MSACIFIASDMPLVDIPDKMFPERPSFYCLIITKRSRDIQKNIIMGLQ